MERKAGNNDLKEGPVMDRETMGYIAMTCLGLISLLASFTFAKLSIGSDIKPWFHLMSFAFSIVGLAMTLLGSGMTVGKIFRLNNHS